MLSDYQTLVTDLVRDDAGKVSTLQRDAAIAGAVTRYGSDRPRIKVQDLTGVSGDLLALPAGWQAGFSDLKTLEYPLGEVPPALLDAADWAMYSEPAADKIMLLNALPAASTVRTAYTIRHQVEVATDTIPLEDRSAVAHYAAAELCDQLAAVYANETDSTIAADSVRQTSKADVYGRRARDYRKFYTDFLGVADVKNAASGAVVQLQSKVSDGASYLFHGRPRRVAH